MELPASFQEQMKNLLQDDYEAFLAGYDRERAYGLRVNTTKITPEHWKTMDPFHTVSIPWISNGFSYTKDVRPARDPYYFAGLYYLQEPSAMTPAHVLPISPGDRVLDLCAAPGGKSTELAAKLNGTGMLVSNDISNSRAKALLKNLELFGIKNAVITSEAPEKLATRFTGFFDKILIDAPCSGEGMFRKEPSVMKSWLEHGNDFFASLQKSIVEQALKMLAPGGMLLYSTCTFSPKEDEQIIAHMLSLDPTLHIVQPQWYEGFDHGHPEWADGNPDLFNCVRIWPHRMAGEGHFLCLLQKDGQVAHVQAKRRKTKLPEELTDFFKNTGVTLNPEQIEIRGESVLQQPEGLPDLTGLRVMRAGLLLGSLKKNRFEPGQALAMSLQMTQYPNTLSLSHDDDRVLRYLKGETIEDENTADGWVLIGVDGYPLGFGKASRGTIKNKYLAGWRWM